MDENPDSGMTMQQQPSARTQSKGAKRNDCFAPLKIAVKHWYY
jgi:hypothetical protein